MTATVPNTTFPLVPRALWDYNGHIDGAAASISADTARFLDFQASRGFVPLELIGQIQLSAVFRGPFPQRAMGKFPAQRDFSVDDLCGQSLVGPNARIV